MYHNERENEIMKALLAENYATVKQLSEWLFTSESSIRRDLRLLEKKGLVNRSYGGVEINHNLSHIAPFHTRAHRNVSAKKIMAQKAVQLIKKGNIVFLDQSSSSYYVAAEIAKLSDITVVTNNIEILTLLSQSDLIIISSGGQLSKSNRNCLVGTDAQRTFSLMNADIMFFSAKALDKDGIIHDCDREEVCLRQAMLMHSNQKIFLCDSTKYNQFSGYTQCTINEIDRIITEINDKEVFRDLENYKELIL